MSEAAPPADTLRPARGPYPGLKPFSESESEYFFGRERDIEIIVANLRAHRLTVLFGPSGVGKSSVLRAGVVPALRRRAKAARAKKRQGRFVPVVFDQWKEDPVRGILHAVRREVLGAVGGEGPAASVGEYLDEELLAWSEYLDGEILLVLDQFEELFEYHPGQGGPRGLDSGLPRVLTREGLPVSVLVSIREDALAQLDDRFKLKIPALLDNRLRVGHLDRESAREAIVEPLVGFNATHSTEFAAEPALVDEILDQVTRGRVQLEQAGRGSVDGGAAVREEIETPYLQLVLTRLWDEEQKSGSQTLSLATFIALGGAQTIVRAHVDEALSTLPADERELAAEAFGYLVTPSGTKIALRPGDLAGFTRRDETKLSVLLEKLTAARILTPVPSPTDHARGPRYEISHDSLAPAVLDWHVRGQLEAERRQKEAAEREAVEAQQREARERNRARFFRTLAITSGTLLVAALAFFAFLQRHAALDARSRSDSRAIAARLQAEVDPNVRLLAGLEAYRLAATDEARSAVLTGLQGNAAFPRILFGHTRDAEDVAFSPDSRTLASASDDASVRLWDVDSGAQLGAPLRTKALEPFISVSFSSDGRRLVAARDDGFVYIWDVRDRRRVRELGRLRAWTSSANVLALSSDPKMPALAVGGDDGTITVWDLSDPQKARRLPVFHAQRANHPADVKGLSFSPRGSLLAVGDDYGDVWLWHRTGPNGGRLRGPFTRDYILGVRDVAFSRDGSKLAAVGNADDARKGVWIWDVRNMNRAPQQWSGHGSAVDGVAFDPAQPQTLVTGGDDTNVLVWDTKAHRAFGPPREHAATVEDVAVSPDGRFVASAGDDDVVKLWALDVHQPLARTLAGGDRDIWDLALGPDGVIAAASGESGTDLWPRRSPQYRASAPTRHFPPEPNHLSYGVRFRGSVLVNATGKAFELRDLARPGALRLAHTRSDATRSTIATLALSPDGTIVATGHFDGTIRLWRRVELLKTLKTHRGRVVRDVQFSPSGDLLASAGEDGTVRLWNVTDPRDPRPIGRPLRTRGEIVLSLAFSPDGTLLASGGADQTAVLWDVHDPDHVVQVGRPLTRSNSILALAFSPDGKVLAVGDGDNDVVLYDVATRGALGEGLRGRSGTDNAIDALSFDESGRALYSAGRGNPITAWSSELWTDDLDTLNREVCRITQRSLTATEWREVFRGTELESGYHDTCPSPPS